MDTLNRREFMSKGALWAGVAYAASFGWTRPAEALDCQTFDFTLTEIRASTFSGIVGALGRSPHSSVRSEAVSQAPQHLQALFDEYGPSSQGFVILLLDEIDTRSESLVRRGSHDTTLEQLRAWSRMSPPEPRVPRGAESFLAREAQRSDGVRAAMLANGGVQRGQVPIPAARRPDRSLYEPVGTTANAYRERLAEISLFTESVRWAELAVGDQSDARQAQAAIGWR